MPISLVSNGRFNQTDPVLKDGRLTYGLWAKQDFLKLGPFDDDVYYVVDNTKMGRPDLIADDVYGTPDLYWILPAAMHQINCTNWPPTGAVLRLPNRSRVFAEV